MVGQAVVIPVVLAMALVIKTERGQAQHQLITGLLAMQLMEVALNPAA